MNIEQLKAKLSEMMENIKKQNPNANWKNLVTGVLILVLVGVFSVWYFSDTQTLNDDALEISLDDENEVVVADDSEVMEETTEPEFTGETTTVEAGESLWKVAVRVCGEGEAYNHLADANGLTIWSDLAVGQTLKVVCSGAAK